MTLPPSAGHTPGQPPRQLLKGCFVTGTDTEVGKTRVSAGLLHWLGAQGLRAAGYKAVASGMEQVDGRWLNEDVQTLWAAGWPGVRPEQVGPLQLRTACAPHIAAALEGRQIDFAALRDGAHALAQQVDCVVAEGAGGLCVPLGPDWDSSDLMCALGLPLVLVVGLRLGCINHALLTAEAIRARGLRLGGWVANTRDPDMPFLTENIATLQNEFARRHQSPCLGVLPRLAPAGAAQMAQAAAAHLNDAALRRLFGLAPA